MRVFIIAGVYLLVPFLAALFYKKLKAKRFIIIPHLIVWILIFLYPYGIVMVDDYLNPPDPEKPACGMGVLGLYIANAVFMIPVTQILLWLFNLYFKNLYFPNKKVQR